MLYDFLHNLSNQMVGIFQKYQSQVLTVAKTILMAIVGTGMSFLQVIFSIIIAGVLLATNGTEAAMGTIFNRMVGDQGTEYLQLTTSTIRSVVKGVLGVAVIQTLLAGFGFFMAGIPHAGIWAVCALVLSIIQVGPGLVIIGVIGFLYTQENHFFATAWTVYFVLVMFSDNILKPILLGKGARVPMLVIFLGVIGGFLLQGFIGLFTGAIVLSIGYKLFLLWMHDQKIVS
jgi:predicted PurR-regulated permease PerM